MCYNRPNLKISPGQNNQGIKHPPWTKCPPGLVVLQPLLCLPNQSLLQEPIQNLGYFLNFRMSFTRPLGWQTSSRTDIQLKDIQLNRHPAAEWKSSRRIWHCHLHPVLLSRGHENFHDDMNMSAIITWSMTPTSLHLPPVLCLSLPSLLSPPSPFMLLNQVHPHGVLLPPPTHSIFPGQQLLPEAQLPTSMSSPLIYFLIQTNDQYDHHHQQAIFVVIPAVFEDIAKGFP